MFLFFWIVLIYFADRRSFYWGHVFHNFQPPKSCRTPSDRHLVYHKWFSGRWWWLSLSVPAGWREQGQPAPYLPSSSRCYRQQQLKTVAATATSDYCDLFERVVNNPALYACRMCGKNVSNRWHHAAIHRPQFNLCPMCRQSFTRKDNMKAHMRLKHGTVVAETPRDHTDGQYGCV